MDKLREFIQVYRLYSRYQSPIYSARISYGVAFRGLPF